MLNLESIWGWGKRGREWATTRRTSTGKSSEIYWKPQECVVSRKIQSKSCLWSYQPVTNHVTPRYCEDIYLQNLLSTCYLCRKVENLSRWVLQPSVTKLKSVLTWQENPSHRKTNWRSTYTYKFIYYFSNLGKFLIFFAKKLNVWNVYLKVVQLRWFSQVYYFSKKTCFTVTPSDPFNLVTVTASYLTHPNVNITYFLFSYYILRFPCNSQSDQQCHFKVQRAMWNHYDCTDILL